MQWVYSPLKLRHSAFILPCVMVLLGLCGVLVTAFIQSVQAEARLLKLERMAAAEQALISYGSHKALEMLFFAIGDKGRAVVPSNDGSWNVFAVPGDSMPWAAEAKTLKPFRSLSLQTYELPEGTVSVSFEPVDCATSSWRKSLLMDNITGDFLTDLETVLGSQASWYKDKPVFVLDVKGTRLTSPLWSVAQDYRARSQSASQAVGGYGVAGEALRKGMGYDTDFQAWLQMDLQQRGDPIASAYAPVLMTVGCDVFAKAMLVEGLQGRLFWQVDTWYEPWATLTNPHDTRLDAADYQIRAHFPAGTQAFKWFLQDRTGRSQPYANSQGMHCDWVFSAFKAFEGAETHTVSMPSSSAAFLLKVPASQAQAIRCLSPSSALTKIELQLSDGTVLDYRAHVILNESTSSWIDLADLASGAKILTLQGMIRPPLVKSLPLAPDPLLSPLDLQGARWHTHESVDLAGISPITLAGQSSSFEALLEQALLNHTYVGTHPSVQGGRVGGVFNINHTSSAAWAAFLDIVPASASPYIWAGFVADRGPFFDVADFVQAARNYPGFSSAAVDAWVRQAGPRLTVRNDAFWVHINAQAKDSSQVCQATILATQGDDSAHPWQWSVKNIQKASNLKKSSAILSK